jgi:ureidoglycolate lyase
VKLFRFGPFGSEKPGALDADGVARDLSHVIQDWTGSELSPSGLESIRKVDLGALPQVPEASRWGPAVMPFRNFVGVGLNYHDHAAEIGAPLPSEPVIFLKSLSSVCGPFDDWIIPKGSTKTDWECELGVVIGSLARSVHEQNAFDHIAGYCVVNDASEQQWQLERAGTWDKGKSFDTFGAIGPFLVTKDEVVDPQNLRLYTDVDGVRYQDGTTQTMVFTIAQLVAYTSRCITLYPGDVIATGTPSGVGLGIKPQPRYLRAGQRVRLGVQGLGEQVHNTVDAPE